MLTSEHKTKIATSMVGNQNRWTGGRIMQKGYVMIRVEEDHPMRGASRYVQEHRLVMAEAIGRMLEPHEVVHHMLEIEGGSDDKTDNRLENLMLFATKGEHNSHHKMLRALARGEDC